MSVHVRGGLFMFDAIWRRKGRLSAFALSFAVGLLLAVVCRVVVGLFVRHAETATADTRVLQSHACPPGESFASPDEVLAALSSVDVGVRREIFRRLFLRPGVVTGFYDYERDKDFPERAEGARLQLVNLDDSPGEEAVITFVRNDSPLAVVLKRCACGWKTVAAISSWLRFEDYPYADWIELPEAIRPGMHVIVVRDSTGDATRYTRRARVLTLAGGRLEQVAEVEEELIAPVEGYAEADWSGVKRRRSGVLAFTPPSSGSPARLRVEYRDEVVRFNGVEPLNVYWRGGDGGLHPARTHRRSGQGGGVEAAARSGGQVLLREAKKSFVPPRG